MLTGAMPDQAELYGVLAEIEALGLELLEVRRAAALPMHPDRVCGSRQDPPDRTRRAHPAEHETWYEDEDEPGEAAARGTGSPK